MQVISALIILVAMLITMLVSACGNDPAPPSSRLSSTYIYNPGAQFQTNINAGEDYRRVIRCSIEFKVIDEEAVEDLLAYNPAIRDAVLTVLVGLTLEELTVDRDLAEVSQKLVDQANQAIGGNYNLILGAYFTDFLIA
jgi:flagellar basal body-associated protein FliL